MRDSYGGIRGARSGRPRDVGTVDGFMNDEQVLGCIERLYALDDGPDWAGALRIVLRALGAQAGVLIQHDLPEPEVRVQVGAPFDWTLEPLLTRGTGQLERRIALHTTQHDGARYIWLLDGAPRTPRRRRISAVRDNLELAIDFAARRSAVDLRPGRLSPPSPARVAAVQARLDQVSDRATDCVLLAARGYTNAQISEHLRIAPGTVARSLQEAYRLLGVGGRSDLDIPVLLTRPKPRAAW